MQHQASCSTMCLTDTVGTGPLLLRYRTIPPKQRIPGGHFTAVIIDFIDVANVFSQISQSKLSKRVLPVTCIVFTNGTQNLSFHICSTLSNLFSKGSGCFETAPTMLASLCEKYQFQNEHCLLEETQVSSPPVLILKTCWLRKNMAQLQTGTERPPASVAFDAARASSVWSFNNFLICTTANISDKCDFSSLAWIRYESLN